MEFLSVTQYDIGICNVLEITHGTDKIAETNCYSTLDWWDWWDVYP